MSLEEIREAWLSVSSRALRHVIRSHPSESFYAAAFHLFYADCQQILPPALAINAESFVTIHEDHGSTWTTRWAPPEWNWDVLDEVSDELKPIYTRLTIAMSDATDEDWDCLIRAHDEVMAQVSLILTERMHMVANKLNELQLPDHFVVAVLEGQREPNEYNALVRASVAPHRLLQLDGILIQ